MGGGAEEDGSGEEKEAEVPRGTLANDKPKKRKWLMRGGDKKRKKRKTWHCDTVERAQTMWVAKYNLWMVIIPKAVLLYFLQDPTHFCQFSTLLAIAILLYKTSKI